MKKNKLVHPNRWLLRIQLTIPIGLSILSLAAVLWSFEQADIARADPGTGYVDGASGSDTGNCQDPAAPCLTIGYALSQAVDGDTIRVAQGTYTENLTTPFHITLEGGYEPISWTRSLTQYETILDGSGGTGQSVVTIPDGNFEVILDGFTITGGDTSGNGGGVHAGSGGSVSIVNAVITGNQSSGDGGGIAAFGPLTLTLQNVVVSNNRAGDLEPPGNGGGLYFRADGLNATLTGVQIYGNTAVEGGGGLRVDDPGASVIISDSLIYTNTALGMTGFGGGGGIGVEGGNLSLARSMVMSNAAPNNEGGGLSVGSGGSVNVVDSVIQNNTTRDHGGAVTTSQASVNMTNVLVTGNATSSGNANVLAINDSDVNIMNGTISANNPQGAQAVILWSGHLTITNSILWNNALNLQGDPPCTTCFTVTYSDIEGSWPGTGNIDEDPGFKDPANDNYHLSLGSPCIDTGTEAGAPDHDLANNPRPLDGDGDGTATTDMGAYEFKAYQIHLPLTLGQVGL